MSVVPGDPASLSACAGTARSVRRAARRPRDRRAHGIRRCWARGGRAAPRRRPAAAPPTWPRPPTPPPPSSTGWAGCCRTTRPTSPTSWPAARALEERARAAGLEVRDGRVEIGWGVTGAADAEADRARAATQAGAAGRARPGAGPAPPPARLGARRAARLDDRAVRPLAPAARWMRGSPHRRARGPHGATDDA